LATKIKEAKNLTKAFSEKKMAQNNHILGEFKP
jgi:hypothetical protein